MCLHTVKFTTKWNKEEKDFVGIGYKSFDYGTLKNKAVIFKKYSKWMTAKFTQFGHTNITNSVYTDSDDMMYPPGFHIWLNEKDARKYDGRSQPLIYKVSYKNVLCFGRNETYTENKAGNPEFGDCVIARYMRVDEYIP